MHRVLIKLGFLNIYSYGAMLALAFFVGTYLALDRAKRQGLEQNKILDLMFYILISSILGARILFVILNRDYYRSNITEIFKVWQGGLVFYGGFILAFIVGIWFLKKNKLPVWKIIDLLTPSLAIGIAIGRTGCFLNGCCYGKISYSWGICFPADQNSPIFSQQLREGLMPPTASFTLPVMPTQLYDSLAALIIFLILLRLEKYRKFDGFLFWIFILLYSIARFITEGLRYYESNFLVWGKLTVSQLISVIIGLAALFILVRNYRIHNR